MNILLKQICNQLIAHNYEIRSRVNNELVLPWYSNSTCRHARIFCGIKLSKTTPNDIKQSANMGRFKKYLKRFYWVLQTILIYKSKCFQLSLILGMVKSYFEALFMYLISQDVYFAGLRNILSSSNWSWTVLWKTKSSYKCDICSIQSLLNIFPLL